MLKLSRKTRLLVFQQLGGGRLCISYGSSLKFYNVARAMAWWFVVAGGFETSQCCWSLANKPNHTMRLKDRTTTGIAHWQEHSSIKEESLQLNSDSYCDWTLGSSSPSPTQPATPCTTIAWRPDPKFSSTADKFSEEDSRITRKTNQTEEKKVLNSVLNRTWVRVW